MAASDGGRSEGSNDPASTGAPTGRASLADDPAARAPGASSPAAWTSSLPGAAAGAMQRAVKASTPSRITVVRFALGMPVGLVISMTLCGLLALVYPLTAPMAFFLTLSTTMATGILLARGLPLKDAFTNEERLRLERLQDLYDMRMEPIDRRAKQMQAHGMSGAEIEAALGPEWRRVREEYDGALAALGATREDPRPALPAGPPRPPEP